MRKILNKIVVWMLQTIGVGLTFISPRVNNEMWYYLCYHRRLHLDNPQEFHEKLCWLKIYNYNNNAEVKRCADKFAVRSYVCEHGLPEILNELIAVYDTPDEIEWNALPDSFVIKSNVGSGDNLIVTKKKELDFNSALNQMKKWKKTYGLALAELQYSNVPHKIMVEKYLSTLRGDIPEDFKLYCFHGKVLAILYMAGRFTQHPFDVFFDTGWNYLGLPVERQVGGTVDTSALPKKPASLDEMIRAAEILSADFPFVRVDFYDIDGKAVFGEMTFTPAGSIYASSIPIKGKDMGEYLTVG